MCGGCSCSLNCTVPASNSNLLADENICDHANFGYKFIFSQSRIIKEKKKIVYPRWKHSDWGSPMYNDSESMRWRAMGCENINFKISRELTTEMIDIRNLAECG